MASSLNKLARLAGRIFTNITKFPNGSAERRQLLELMNNIKLDDIPFDRKYLIPTGPWNRSHGAPVTYVPLWEDDKFIMSIFILHHGVRLPLHDHPDMNGFIKVIHGKALIHSYTTLEDKHPPKHLYDRLRLRIHAEGVHLDVKCVERLPDKTAQAEDPVCCLTPNEANVHEIWAVDGPMAFLDILSPPYDHTHGSRECRYYQDTSTIPGIGSDPDQRYLLRIGDPPDYWCKTTPYLGEKLDPYADIKTSDR